MTTQTPHYPRFSKAIIQNAIEDSPVILIHGTRQCGKTTLALQLGEALGYISFDDDLQRQFAIADPIGFVHSLNSLF